MFLWKNRALTPHRTCRYDTNHAAIAQIARSWLLVSIRLFARQTECPALVLYSGQETEVGGESCETRASQGMNLQPTVVKALLSSSVVVVEWDMSKSLMLECNQGIMWVSVACEPHALQFRASVVVP